MKSAILVLLTFAAIWTVEAATNLRPAPPGAPKGAPPEYLNFSSQELAAGFSRLAFGSDMQRFNSVDRIHKFDHAVRFHISNKGKVDHSETYRKILSEFARRVQMLEASFVDEETAPDVIVRLIDARNFNDTLAAALGNDRANTFINQTNPRCTTRLRSDDTGVILRADIFIIVDQGSEAFLDCAYHETLHAFGLMNHANDLPWTALNQTRQVGYLSTYDQMMLRILYHSKIRSGMTPSEVASALPEILRELRR